MSVNIEIHGDELKQYVSVSRSISFNAEGCRLRSKTGRVVFDLSSFDRINECGVFIKKLSGNGKVRISSGSNVHDAVASLRSPQKFTIRVAESHAIEILRTNDGTGELSIVGLVFNAEGEDSEVSQNWKAIIGKCGKFGSLRMVKDRLFASSGAYIDKGYVVTAIETNPPNMYRRDGDKLLFIGSCEITFMDTNPAAQSIPRNNINLYPSRQAPTEMTIPTQTSKPLPGLEQTVIGTLKSFAPTDIVNSLYEHVKYDSKKFRGFKPNQNKYSKIIRSGGQTYLLLKQNSTCYFSIATLEPDKEYICIINGKKLNGNGRVHVGISVESVFKKGATDVLFAGHFSNRYVTLKSDGLVPGKLQRFHLMMPNKYCNGDVLINRIIVIENIGLKVAQDGLNYHEYFSDDQPTKVEPYSYNISVDHNDPVFVSAKKYAVYCSTISCDMDEFGAKIASKTIGGTMWFNKIKSVLPNTKAAEKDEANVLTTARVGHIGQSDYVWLDVFDGDIPSEDLEKLRKAKKITSPSLLNVEKLQSLIPDVQVAFGHKPLPFIKSPSNPFFDNNDYVIALDRDQTTTKRLLEAWNNDLPKLVIVGGRGRYPNYVIPINEYMPYHELLYAIGHAKCMIDMPSHCDYASSFLSIAHAMDVPIVSTNKFVLCKSHCILLPNEDSSSTVSLPSKETLIRDVLEAMKMPRKAINNMDNYNKKFLDYLGCLFDQ